MPPGIAVDALSAAEIQRLFALGMRLRAAERLADGAIAEHIGGAVDAIDEVIREIRETIFDLNRPDSSGPKLRQLLRGVAATKSVRNSVAIAGTHRDLNARQADWELWVSNQEGPRSAALLLE